MTRGRKPLGKRISIQGLSVSIGCHERINPDGKKVYIKLVKDNGLFMHVSFEPLQEFHSYCFLPKRKAIVKYYYPSHAKKLKAMEGKYVLGDVSVVDGCTVYKLEKVKP
jgi:hypothetical protein